MKTDLSKRKLLIIDNGYFTSAAEHCAKYYGKVYYNRPTAAVFLQGSQHSIGRGLPGVEWVDEYEPCLDKVDETWFPDVNHGSKQVYLKSKGYPICGAIGGEIMEQDKRFCLKKMHDAGLPLPKTWYFKGLDAAWEFLKNKFEKFWIKPAEKYRGDLNTFPHISPYMTEIVFNVIRKTIGIVRSKEIGILIQADIPDAIELGPDGFRKNGKIIPPFTIGGEEKGMAYLCRTFGAPPPVMAPFFERTGPIYDALGYQGPYSSEMRIRPDGLCLPIDETNRCGNPPTCSLLKLYEDDYPQAICDLANDREPILNPKCSHAGELILRSDWHDHEELWVDIPGPLREWVLLKNAMKRDGQTICIENSCGGQFASVVAVGNSVEEVAGLLEERVKQLKIFKLEYMTNFLDVMRPKIEKAKEYAGIDLEKGNDIGALAA